MLAETRHRVFARYSSRMNTWILPAVLCMAAWGFSRLFPKMATNSLDPKSAMIYEVMGEMLVAFFVLASLGFRPAFDLKGSGYAMLAGILGAIGVYFYLVAADRGNVSQLVAVTALYPVITVLLGVFVLNETVSLKEGIGMVLALIAILLVVT